MERVLCWRWTISTYVFTAECVLELGAVVGDRQSLHEVVISPSHTLQLRCWLYIDLRSLDIWNRCRVGSGGTVCMFWSYIGCIWHMLLVIDAVWGRNLTLMRAHWSSFVEYVGRMSCGAAPNKQLVSSYCLNSEVLPYWCLMQYEVVISLSCAV